MEVQEHLGVLVCIGCVGCSCACADCVGETVKKMCAVSIHARINSLAEFDNLVPSDAPLLSRCALST